MRQILGKVIIITVALARVKAQSLSSTRSASDAQPSLDINVASVPDCAKQCLSNSTQYAIDCQQIDVQCLCNSPSYVSALSCCLATNCDPEDQQTAIQFNIQECAAVNSTAPNFVGCSPFSITTGGANPKTTSPSSSSNVSTVTNELATVPTVFTGTALETASFTGGSLLTGSCTVPLFAQVTEDAGGIIEFPQVGCALNRGGCCPFDPVDYAGITKCPDDYATTSGACCPKGYSIFSTALGAETPCYSRPSQVLVPGTTPSITSLTLITDTVFSRKYMLVTPPKPQLPLGGIIGITINATLFAALPFIIVWYIRRHKRRRAALDAEKQRQAELTGPAFPPSTTIPYDQPTLISEAPTNPARSPTTPHELASLDSSTQTPATIKSLASNYPFQPVPAAPPAYEKPAADIPLEMPGSTYMHEHHPLFTGSTPDLERLPALPRSPGLGGDGGASSPILSPATPFSERTEGSSMVVTPLGSPRLGQERSGVRETASTRFKEGSM